MKLRVQDILNVSFFSALTAIGASIRIPLPFSDVPITLQALFTYMAGTLLGGYLGALSQLIYIFMGAAGLPVFAGWRAGIPVLVGPTGGYLFGFVPGAFLVGKLAEMRKNPSFRWLLTCMMAGTIVIYLMGIVQLMAWTRTDLAKAFVVGVLPFIPGDSLKMMIAAYITIRIKKILPMQSAEDCHLMILFPFAVRKLQASDFSMEI